MKKKILWTEDEIFKLSLLHSSELFYDRDFNLAHIKGEEGGGWKLDEVGE